MGEEVLDLPEGDLGQVAVVLHVVIALSQFGGGDGDQLFVAAGFVLHQQYADDPATHDRPRHDRAGVGHNHVAGIAVA